MIPNTPSVFEAIKGRRAIQKYEDKPVDEATIRKLIDNAILAPSALNSQPWVFAVIEGKAALEEYSERAKAYFLGRFSPGKDPHARKFDQLASDQFNVFFGAPLAIVIYSKSVGQFSVHDCCLAAQNLMLAAHAMGLGSCPVGYAQGWFDTEEVKTELGVDAECTAVLPIAIGHPAERPTMPPRQEPSIVWASRLRVLR